MNYEGINTGVHFCTDFGRLGFRFKAQNLAMLGPKSGQFPAKIPLLFCIGAWADFPVGFWTPRPPKTRPKKPPRPSKTPPKTLPRPPKIPEDLPKTLPKPSRPSQDPPKTSSRSLPPNILPRCLPIFERSEGLSVGGIPEGLTITLLQSQPVGTLPRPFRPTCGLPPKSATAKN